MAACTWAGSQQPDSAPAQTHYVVFMSAWLTRVGWDWERVGGGGGGQSDLMNSAKGCAGALNLPLAHLHWDDKVRGGLLFLVLRLGYIYCKKDKVR